MGTRKRVTPKFIQRPLQIAGAFFCLSLKLTNINFTMQLALPSSIHNSKLAGLVITTIIYILAIAAAWYTIINLPPYHPLIKILIADIAATIVVFIFSYLLNNSSMYDPFWSVYPAVAALYIFYLLPENYCPPRTCIVLGLAFLYAIRLTTNWMRDWPGLHHQDWRYVRLQEQNGKFYWLVSLAGIHLFPTIMTYLGGLPMYPSMAEASNPLYYLDYIGITITLFAIILCFIADEQMRTFRKNKKAGETFTGGAWKYSRHPNYVGETLFWWGLWIISLAANPTWWWLGLIGPVIIYLLFEFISVPYMETRSKERRPNYEQTTKGIPKYFPWR